MIISLYAIAYNEELLLPYFLKHHSFCDRITILDHRSEDNTVKIAEDFGAKVEPYPGKPDRIDEGEFRDVANHYWKRDRGHVDWVIWLDVDEFLISSGIHLYQYLQFILAKRITLPKVQGYTMKADTLPKGKRSLVAQFPNGVKDGLYSKRAVFHPSIDINYGYGRHRCNPAGSVVEDAEPHIRLLHYTYFGIEYFEQRRQRLHMRRGYPGTYYHGNEKYSERWFNNLITEDVRCK